MARNAAANTPPADEEERRTAPASQVPATTKAAMPDFMQEHEDRDAGIGVSTDQADNIVPLIYILQSGSPQVDEANPAYIEGAKAGHIWLRNYSERPILDGRDGFDFIPSFFSKEFAEWTPRERGGGFAGRHACRKATRADIEKYGADVKLNDDIPNCPDAKMRVVENQQVWSRPNGNDLVLTRNHAGLAIIDQTILLPYVIPFKSTGHAVSKTWMGTINRQLSAKGVPLASFSRIYRLTTRQRVNAKGKWYLFDVALGDYVRDPGLYDQARSLALAFASGEKVAEEEVAGVGGGYQEDTQGMRDVSPGADGKKEMGDEIPF